MQNYELLFILPGTLGEDEVSPVVSNVKEVVEKSGSENVKIQDLGKSRIAYPMKHIRYGYFQLCQFKAEPGQIAEIRGKIRLMPDLLRAVITKSDSDKAVINKISAISDVTIRDNTGKAEEKKSGAKEVEHEAVGHHFKGVDQEKTKAAAKEESKEKTETKAENIKMEDIDKKLDALLEEDIAGV